MPRWPRSGTTTSSRGHGPPGSTASGAPRRPTAIRTPEGRCDGARSPRGAERSPSTCSSTSRVAFTGPHFAIRRAPVSCAPRSRSRARGQRLPRSSNTGCEAAGRSHGSPTAFSSVPRCAAPSRAASLASSSRSRSWPVAAARPPSLRPYRLRDLMFVFKAAVLGAGTMGGEIAQVIASADVPVVMKDVKQELVDAGLNKAREVTQGQLSGLVGKEKITQEQADARLEEILGMIEGTTEYEGFGEVDFVVEAVPEKMQVKQAVFAELDEITPGHAILASNTSALSISEIGSATTRPDKVVGFHFFYPASVMRLIEVVEGEDTSEETAQAAANFSMQIRKNPIRCGEEPGFVVNRVLNSAASEIWRHQDESGAPPEEIDKEIAAAKVTPMGPFYLSDLLGLDTVLHVAEHLQTSYGDRFYVHPRMKELVEAGKLGQKTGEGYYTHGG